VWIDASGSQAFPTVLNQDGAINSQTDPAALNSVLTFYATGWQSNFPFLTDGQVETSAQNVCGPGGPLPVPVTEVRGCQVVPSNILPIGVVTYAGAAPGIVAGITQFNVLISTGGAIVGPSNDVGPYTFSITAAGYGPVSQTVWVKL
jgi:uncharacterized protein (TIGR03437 family)